MQRILLVIILWVMGATATGPALAADGITIDNAQIRATHAAAKVTAAFLAITNTGDSDARIIGVASPIAAKGEIHTMEVRDGIMRMRPVQGGLVIPAGETVRLEPGGLHLMLMGLNTPPRQGDKIMLELVFENRGRKTITAKVVGNDAHDKKRHKH